MIEWMKSQGFKIEEEIRFSEFQYAWTQADVLLLGCYSRDVENAKNALDMLERGLYGVMQGWGVLYYFVDDKIRKNKKDVKGFDPVYSTSEFSADCIDMLHRHIWRYYDKIAHIGLMNTLTQLVGAHIDEYNKFEKIPDLKSSDTFGDKLYRFKAHIRKKIDVSNDREWELFDATSNCLLHTRNFYTHIGNDSGNAKLLLDKFVNSYKTLAAIAFKHNAYIPFVDDERGKTVDSCFLTIQRYV